MKILIINKLYSPWIGGVESVAQDIAEGMVVKGHDVTVLCCQPKGKANEEIINGVNVVRAASFGMFMSMPLSWDFIKKCKTMINQYDVVQTHTPFPLVSIVLSFIKFKTPLVVHYHSDIVRQKIFGFLLRPFIKRTLSKAKYIVGSSPNLIQNSPVLKGFFKKCRTIHFGVDHDEIEKALDERKVEDLQHKYGKFVLFVGRFVYYKGVMFLLEAIKNTDQTLVMIGKGPLKEKMMRFIKDNNMEDRVHLIEPQEKKELWNWYKAAEVFVLPSTHRSEAFGLVLMEAMAVGTPVISTELGTGTSYVNVDGETGMVVESQNVTSLKFAIQKLSDADEVIEKYGKQAKMRVKNEFTKEKMLQDYEKLFSISVKN